MSEIAQELAALKSEIAELRKEIAERDKREEGYRREVRDLRRRLAESYDWKSEVAG